MTRSIVNLLGIVLVLLGVIGFFNDPIFNLFETSVALNIVYLVLGVLALSFGNMGEMPARNYALFFGVVFGIITIMGFASEINEVAGMPINNATNWLHLVITALSLPLGLIRPTGIPRPARA